MPIFNMEKYKYHRVLVLKNDLRKEASSFQFCIVIYLGSKGSFNDAITLVDFAVYAVSNYITLNSCFKKNVIMPDMTSAVNASESACWDKIPYTEILRQASPMPSCQAEDVSERLNFRVANSSLLLIPRPDSVQLQRKAGKVSRSGNGCSKRPRMAQMEDPVSQGGVDDVNGGPDKLGPCPAKCSFPEKTQVAKQKNNLNGKRGDKRNFKNPTKTKYDSFSPKTSLVSFTSAAGGNNILGLYGLKSDTQDVTKHVDELSLNELLDGTYKCTSLGKDKGKKAANVNENILHSITKACSILQLRRPVHSHNFAEIDASSCRKVSPCLLSSVSCVAGISCGDKGDTNATDLASYEKDSCCMSETPGNSLDFPLYQPKDILERLALPPPKDLESLLLDAAKPALSSRNTLDSRSGKTSHRACLPPFPWSHAFSGHCKSNSDAVKLSTSRSTCQGRWASIGSTASFLGVVTDCFTDLKSFTYDHSLVPSRELKSGILDKEIVPSTSVSLPWCEVGLSASATSSKTFLDPPEFRGDLKYQGNAGHSPRLLAAAQTLYDIATQSLRHSPYGMIRWPKKPSQKAMKARKSKSNEKAGEVFATPKSIMMSDNLVKSAEQMMPSKKPKLSTAEKKKDLAHAHGVIKGPLNWSAPRSCRSSPSKSVRDLVTETKHFSANIVKQSSLVPSPARVLENKTCNSQQKLRKVVTMDWNRTRDKLD